MRDMVGVSFYNSATVAKIIHEVAVDSVKTSTGLLMSRWYQAGQVASLNLWTTPDGKVVRQKLELLGQLVIWDKENGLRTGLLVDDERIGERAHYDPTPNLWALKWAYEIITMTEGVPEPFKKQILKNWNMLEKKGKVLSFFKVGKKKR